MIPLLMKQPKKKESVIPEYTIGQVIRHTKWGTGEVINVIPGEAIKVQFGKTQRILLLQYNKTTIL